MLTLYKYALTVSLISLISTNTMADEFFKWHTTNIQALQSNNYKLGPKRRNIITLEHANTWQYGDFYGFCDLVFKDGDKDDDLYCEATPRVSLSKTTGLDLSYGILKDISLAFQTEQGENSLSRYNYGIGIDLNFPHFKFFKINNFIRNNPDKPDRTFQIYTAWNLPFELYDTKFIFEGFVDIFGEEGGSTAPSQLTQPRLLIDVGDLVWNKNGKFYAGIEYQYWHNKFGIKGITESTPQLQIKWVF